MSDEDPDASVPRADRPALIAHALYPGHVLPIVPAPRERRWMDETPSHAAYRCLPLAIANQHAWHVLSNQRLRVVWDGSVAPEGVTIEALAGDGPCWASRNFGSGIVTWTIPYLFQTSPGYDLLARGPANMPKDGVCALEGIVETDWAHATFTMNWKLTRPHHPVEFAIGEPICALVPQPRGLLESFAPIAKPLDRATRLGRAYQEWADGRVAFREEMKRTDDGTLAQHKIWQKNYFFGRDERGDEVAGHRTRLDLAPFATSEAPTVED